MLTPTFINMDNSTRGGHDPVRPDTSEPVGLPQGHIVDEPKNCPLASLPDEIILLIVDNGSLDRRSLRNFALASLRLFHVSRPRFYQGYGYETFRRAVGSADVDAMERCAGFDAAPVDFDWETVYECKAECRPKWDRGHTPLAILMDNFSPDWNGGVVEDVVVDRSYDAVQWLLDHGANTNQPSAATHCPAPPDIMTTPWLPRTRCKSVMFHLLPELLLRGMDRRKVDAVCRLVSLLCARGAAMPLELEDTLVVAQHQVQPHRVQRIGVPPTVLEIGLLLHCPPSISEHLLTDIDHHGVSLTTLGPQK